MARGRFYLGASLNEFAANQFEVAVDRSPDCARRVQWNTVDLLRGFRKRRLCRRTFWLTSTNFVGDRAVRSGAAKLGFSADGATANVESVTVLPGSGLYQSRLGPARIEFAKPLAPSEIPVDRWSKILITLRNAGDRPARKIAADAISSPGLQIRRDGLAIPKSIGDGEAAKGRLWIKPSRAGQFKVFLSATTSANQPGTEFTVFSTPSTPANRAFPASQMMGWIGISAVGLLILLIGWPRAFGRRN